LLIDLKINIRMKMGLAIKKLLRNNLLWAYRQAIQKNSLALTSIKMYLTNPID